MKTNKLELEVLINGRTITEFNHEGQTFIEGRHRSEFSLRLTNRNLQRKLFVPSVDGLSIVNGLPASSESAGFVLDAGDEITIPGWMMNNDQAAKFYFSLSQKEPSYSSKLGHGDQNNGVIGVRVFDEERTTRLTRPEPFPDPYQPTPCRPNPNPWDRDSTPWQPHQPIWCSAGSSELPRWQDKSISDCDLADDDFMKRHSYAADMTASISSSEKCDNAYTKSVSLPELGAGWGESTKFKTSEVEFKKAVFSRDLVIFYDTLRGLAAQGVDVKKKKARRSSPGASAFPGDYCRSPK